MSAFLCFAKEVTSAKMEINLKSQESGRCKEIAKATTASSKQSTSRSPPAAGRALYPTDSATSPSTRKAPDSAYNSLL